MQIDEIKALLVMLREQRVAAFSLHEVLEVSFAGAPDKDDDTPPRVGFLADSPPADVDEDKLTQEDIADLLGSDNQ